MQSKKHIMEYSGNTTILKCYMPISHLPKNQKAVFATLFVFIAVVASFLNIGMLTLFIKTPSLGNKSHFHLLSLIIGDVIVGVLLSPITVKKILIENYQNCFVNYFGPLVSVSGVAIVVITYDRYVHIWKGLRYDGYMTKKRFSFLISCTWLSPLIFFLAKLISKECLTWTILLAYMLLFSSIIGSYLKIVGVLRSRLHAECGCITTRALIQRQNKRSVRLICLVGITFILMTSGMLLIRIFMTCHYYLPGGFIWFKKNESSIRAFGKLLFQMNSLINPILYYTKHRIIRSEIRRYIRTFRRFIHAT